MKTLINGITLLIINNYELIENKNETIQTKFYYIIRPMNDRMSQRSGGTE